MGATAVFPFVPDSLACRTTPGLPGVPEHGPRGAVHQQAAPRRV